MDMKQAIGGYFSLELPKYDEYHKNAIRLNTGRNCLEYILLCRHYRKLYIPYYTCAAVLEPIKKLGINYVFYSIDSQFEITDDISLNSEEALLYTNYFGLKTIYIKRICEKFGYHLIIDNTQAFYANPLSGIDTFYTCRKFFGVADGAYLYTEAKANFAINIDLSYERMNYLIKRIDLTPQEGYADFQKSEENLSHIPIKSMSKLTQRIMQSIDYIQVANQRKSNFLFLHNALKDSNQLVLNYNQEDVPMVYPYLTIKDKLRDSLIKQHIFIAKYWPNVSEWAIANMYERYLADHLIPLPIDQRYSEKEMNQIIQTIISQ